LDDLRDYVSINSSIATISAIPIVMTMCITEMPLKVSFKGSRAKKL